MRERQTDFLLQSVEEGVLLVRDHTNKALIAGRETLFYDIQKFGKLAATITIYFLFGCLIFLLQVLVIFTSVRS